MPNFQKIYLVLTLLFLPVMCKHGCTDKCGRVHIEFPFYLRNNNLSHNTGFELFCNDKNETLLQLPAVPFQLFVKRIDYKAHQIEIYDPQNCLPNVFLKLGNSSVHPFQFQPFSDQQRHKVNVSFFHCNSQPCPIFKESDSYLIDPEMISCIKVKDVLNVLWYVYDDYPDGRINTIMKWSKSKYNCGRCEAQGQSYNGGQVEQCPQCGAKFSSVTALVDHVQNVHERSGNRSGAKVTIDVCPKCSRGFRDPVSLVEHVERDHGGSSRA